MNETTQPTATNELSQNLNNSQCFTATKLEGLCALLSYIAAYLYISRLYEYGYSPWPLAVVAALIIVITELLNLNQKRSIESFVWLGCFILCTVSRMFRIGTVWDKSQTFLFIHIFAVWWVLSRNGKLLEGKSGHLLPADAFNGFIRIPFSRFFLRIRSLVYNLFHALTERGPDGRKRNIWVVPTVLICVLLFALSVSLLMQSDSVFRNLLSSIFGRLNIRLNGEVITNFILSLPVGAWLFGLMCGSSRLQKENLDKQRNRIYSFLSRIKKVPANFWAGVIGIFTVLYLSYFVFQGTYLFGAFTRTLPDGFIVSQYAREGFFELCKVIAVNFTVLWLVTRMTSYETSKKPIFLAVCLVLLAESMLFAVIAFSKLYLYISCFGFTPLRLQSAWLICVLFAGCLLWAYTLVTGKPVFRKWMFFGAVSLSILTLF